MITLTLFGDLDLATAPDLEITLRSAVDRAKRGLVVRTATLSFIGAAGLRSLEFGQQIAEAAGKTYVVVADNWQLRIASVVPGLKLRISLVEGPEGWKMQAPPWVRRFGLVPA